MKFLKALLWVIVAAFVDHPRRAQLAGRHRQPVGRPAGRHQAAGAAAGRVPARLPPGLARLPRAGCGGAIAARRRSPVPAPRSPSTPRSRSNEPDLRRHRHARPRSRRSSLRRQLRLARRRPQARPRILRRQRPGGRRRDGRARPADLPRPQAARHPQHRRQGDAGAGPLEPAILTVHAAGGRAMLEEAKAAAPTGTKVVAVTVLTSLDADDLRSTGVSGSPGEQVERLAALAREAGLDGIVCSGAEVASARRAWPDGFFVVPGVRPEGSGAGDQKRVITPRAGARRWRVGAGHRPADHRRRRPGRGRAGDRRHPLRRWTAYGVGLTRAGRSGATNELAEPGPQRDPVPAQAADDREPCGTSAASAGRWSSSRNGRTISSVCPRCDHHDRIGPQAALRLLFDDGKYEMLPSPEVREDPLKFRDTKRYTDRLKAARTATGERDALLNARGTIDGRTAIVGVQDFAFMGGSMGIAVGAAFVAGARAAIEAQLPLRPLHRRRRRADAGRHIVADADAADDGRARRAARSRPALHRRPDRPDHRRRHRFLCDARRRPDRRARRADRLCRPAGDRADDPRETARRLPARRISARARHDRHGRAAPAS